MRLMFVVQIETSPQLLDVLPSSLVQIFIVFVDLGDPPAFLIAPSSAQHVRVSCPLFVLHCQPCVVSNSTLTASLTSMPSTSSRLLMMKTWLFKFLYTHSCSARCFTLFHHVGEILSLDHSRCIDSLVLSDLIMIWRSEVFMWYLLLGISCQVCCVSGVYVCSCLCQCVCGDWSLSLVCMSCLSDAGVCLHVECASV